MMEKLIESFRVYPPQGDPEEEGSVTLQIVDEEHVFEMPGIHESNPKLTKPRPMTPRRQYRLVGMGEGLKPSKVKAAVQGMLKFAAAEITNSGSFQLADMIKFTLIHKPATATKPRSKMLKAIPLKKFKELVKSNKTY